jgi:hypothetical protein
MTAYYTALALWAAFLILAIFYTRHAKHRQTRPLAAYLIFVTIFTVGSFVVFAAISVLLQALGQAETLSHPVVGPVFLLMVFLPALLLARWQLRKPPRHSSVPG